MPLKSYGVLVGRPVDRRVGSGKNPHYQIHVVDETTDYRIAVNVKSQESPSEVEYLIDDRFAHPLLTPLAELDFGWHVLPARPGGVAIDLIRANVADRDDFVPLPFNVAGPDNDLNEKVDAQIQRAMGDEDAVLYAFGERWGPEKVKDKIFGFLPGNGVHDIHMNQGNVARFAKDDGVWQDGALLIHYPTQNQWVAIFLKFQSQTWHTDDRTGHRLGEEIEPQGELPSAENPDGIVRIVAALVNSKKTPEVESVTLVNASPTDVSLAGWSLADKDKKRFSLKGTIAAGASLQVKIAKPMELSNNGGIISLLNDDGLKVDGVSYTKQQAANPGWTIVF
ncbi:MAG TPA: DUF2278 family protein [Thermoanaerobaculia bacterium]|jgi:uncharacterized protein YukJ